MRRVSYNFSSFCFSAILLYGCGGLETGSAEESIAPSGKADTNEYGYTIPLVRLEGSNCPKEIKVGRVGESYVQGIKHTLALKDYVVSGSLKVKTATVASLGEIVSFNGALKDAYKSCNLVGYEPCGFNPDNGGTLVKFINGMIIVDILNKGAVNINKLSTWNDQVIFSEGENM